MDQLITFLLTEILLIMTQNICFSRHIILFLSDRSIFIKERPMFMFQTKYQNDDENINIIIIFANSNIQFQGLARGTQSLLATLLTGQ